MHVLIIEDDSVIAKNIQKMLRTEGMTSTISLSGKDGIYRSEVGTYDVIILDWMLPDKSGIEVCETIRSKENRTPIIILTAKSQLEDKITGLNMGADDYLTKPFAMEELIARVKALIRRKSGVTVSPILAIADLSVNTNTHEVKRGKKVILLAPREYALLEYLILNKGKTVTREALLHHVWGEDIDPFSNTVDVHIRYLRKKIDDKFSKKLIKTIKNTGYAIWED